jgi:16S rRNA (uracil1498-N3)-methyltransferase
MTRRYFLPELPDAGGPVSLPPEEAQHAARVMRVTPGDEVTLFDGRGRRAAAVVTAVDRREVFLESQPALSSAARGLPRITLAVALPKGDRGKWLIEKLTELGVGGVTPLQCERSQHPPSAAALNKLRRTALESCKQCERDELLRIDRPVPLPQLCANLSPALDSGSESRRPCRWIAHPGGEAICDLLPNDLQQLPPQLLVLVGPEGGFSDDEVQMAQRAGFVPVGLGANILRIETAALSLVAGVNSQRAVQLSAATRG